MAGSGYHHSKNEPSRLLNAQIIWRQDLGIFYSKQDQIIILMGSCPLPPPQLSGFLWKLQFWLSSVPLSLSLKLGLRIHSHFVTQTPSAILSHFIFLCFSKRIYKESGRYYHLQVTALQMEKAEAKYNGQVLDFFCSVLKKQTAPSLTLHCLLLHLWVSPADNSSEIWGENPHFPS